MAEYIEREAVKKRMQAHHDFYLKVYGGFDNMPPDGKARVDELTNCIAEVVNSPAADVVDVVYGRWEQIGYDEAMDRISCSCCKEYWNIIDNDTETFNYCPNCGARMDGDGNG